MDNLNDMSKIQKLDEPTVEEQREDWKKFNDDLQKELTLAFDALRESLENLRQVLAAPTFSPQDEECTNAVIEKEIK